MFYFIYLYLNTPCVWVRTVRPRTKITGFVPWVRSRRRQAEIVKELNLFLLALQRFLIVIMWRFWTRSSIQNVRLRIESFYAARKNKQNKLCNWGDKFFTLSPQHTNLELYCYSLFLSYLYQTSLSSLC